MGERIDVERHFGESGIVRVGVTVGPAGERTFRLPVHYYVTDSGYAEIKGFKGFDPNTNVHADYKAIIRAINQATGRLVAYDREGPPALRFVQKPLAETGESIVMTVAKKQIPHPDVIGTDEGKHFQVALMAAEQIAAGHYELKNGRAGGVIQSTLSPLPDGRKGVRISIKDLSFDRYETSTAPGEPHNF